MHILNTKADTCMLLHLEDAIHQWHSKVSIHTVDADVVVLAITAAQHLTSVNCGLPLELENLRFLAAHEIASDVSHVFVDIFL